ncbi:MAG: DUF5702 domain-containing protein [Lachnospiraceae bacterium]
MNNKGQTTVLLSILLCVLLSLTLTAFEVIRLHTGKVKAAACVHSMRTGIMADYNEELFSRYHLLFMDPTYGTDSYGYLEEKVRDYLEVSLNGDSKNQGVYAYSIEDICVTNQVGIVDHNYELLKKQIIDYEKEAGLFDFAGSLIQQRTQSGDTLERALNETEQNAVAQGNNTNISSEGENQSSNTRENESQVSQQEDPREILSNMLEGGILNLVMPGNTLSNENYGIGSDTENNIETENRNTDFQDIGLLTGFLRNTSDDNGYSGFTKEAAVFHYITTHFSNGVHPYKDTVLTCELEYLLENKSSDKANMEACANDLIWLRMPMNYAYLLSDSTKKKEAEAIAVGICLATGIPEFEKIVQYLLLGCWSYGEAIYDVKDLLGGQRVPLVKTAKNWKTDLKSLTCSQQTDGTVGLTYEEYMLLLFAKKYGVKMDTLLERMLDVMELNIQQNNPAFRIKNCVGEMDIQGCIVLEPLFSIAGSKEIYNYFFNETLSYSDYEKD